MSDIKLFRLSQDKAEELQGGSVALERSLQRKIEQHLDVFLSIRFLASEYSTGVKHRGRIDTLGIDENGCPVIIEYKRSVNENVINQGLYYLDWLMDHKAEFELMVAKTFGTEAAEQIEWSSPRLLCIAGDFTKYDEYAVEQINRNIELLRYRTYGDELMLFELVNFRESDGTPPSITSEKEDYRVRTEYKTFAQYLEQAPQDLKELFEEVKSYILSLGDDIQSKQLKYYLAFKRLKNFCCVEVHPSNKVIRLFLKIDPSTIELEKGFSRDVSKVGHYGTGDLEITLASPADLERGKLLIQKSYESS